MVGVLWACSDSDESDYSVFSPEYFVNDQYSPFFYTSMDVYYGMRYAESSNTQFNTIVVDEWDDYLNHQVAKPHLEYLLLKASSNGIDSIQQYGKGLIKVPPSGYADSVKSVLTGKKANHFLSYLKLARACESYAVNDDWGAWDSVQRHHSEPDLEARLLTAFKHAPDDFIKQRLWFQLVRHYYFGADSVTRGATVKVFEQYKGKFPQNLIWYRALGYVAGYYYANKDYARANYLYSLCYSFSEKLKVPSFWSFHPQEESDWNQTLRMAKSKEEQITLWHMLGVQEDAGRGIEAIAKIDPKSEKLDLLLSRLINIREAEGRGYELERTDSIIRNDVHDKKIVEELAKKNNTAKPYFWNLAAGYLNYLDTNYTAAANFYAVAKKQFPKKDTLILAQSKVLDVLLQVNTLKKVDAAAEAKLTEPLNWLADLRDSKISITSLRFGNALYDCTQQIAKLYQHQNDLIKSLCFNDDLSGLVYRDSAQTEALIHFLNKPNHTAFEKTMLRYYPHTVTDLYYHQAIRLVYLQQTKAAIAYLKKRPLKDFELYGNPFNGRLIDCHDCDHEAPQKQKFTPLHFLQTLENMQSEIRQGKNVYRNALLAANAYYNITYYGNARLLYESDISTSSSYGYTDPDSLDTRYKSMAVATKFYQLARRSAVTNEQKARCTFMLAKCALNDIYNLPDYNKVKPAMYIDEDADNAANQRYTNYFKELKQNYSQTAYYREALKECGYFSAFVQQPVRGGKQKH